MRPERAVLAVALALVPAAAISVQQFTLDEARVRIERLESRVGELEAAAIMQPANAQATIAAFATAAAVATRAAEIEAVATARALEGDGALAAALATNEALIVSGQLGQIDLATAQAQSTESAATVIALEQQQADLQVTATALARAALAGSLNPDSRTVTIRVNLDRFLNNRSDAFEDAANQLSGALAPYRVPDCRVGFVLIGGYAPELGAGIQLAEGIEGILFGQFPTLFTRGQTGVQRFWNPSAPNSNGTVELEMFFYNGCTQGSIRLDQLVGYETPTEVKQAEP